ncbi:hypothetical protein RA278_29060, partial [Pseudomonas syringae pv. tagetis]
GGTARQLRIRGGGDTRGLYDGRGSRALWAEPGRLGQAERGGWWGRVWQGGRGGGRWVRVPGGRWRAR